MIALLLAAACALPSLDCARGGQDEIDAQLQALMDKLASDPTTAKLASLLTTEHGLQAVRERVEWILAARDARFERDPVAHYEDHRFSRDDAGALALRPERRADFDLLAREAARSRTLMEPFNRRLDAFAGRIAEGFDLDKRARAMWQDPVHRLSLFQSRVAEFGELSPAENLVSTLTGKLVPDANGRLRVNELLRAHVRWLIDRTTAQLETLQAYEKAFLRAVAAEKDDATRRLAISEPGTAFLLGRLARQALEGSELAVGGLQESDEEERRGVSFNLELGDFAEDIRRLEALARKLAPSLEKAAAELADDEAELASFLRRGRVRLLLFERVMAMSEEQVARAEAAMDAVCEDGFVESDGMLAVKKGRFVDENGADSADALEAEHRRTIDEFFGSRADYDLIAERCADPAVAKVYANAAATFIVRADVENVIQSLRAAARQDAVAAFVRLYLEKRGDALALRPERAEKVDELVRRAAEIKKEKEGM